MKKNKKDKNQKIALRSYTKGGRIATLIAICSLLIIASAIAISVVKKGEAGIYVGLMPIVSLVLSIFGFGVGLKSYTEDTKFLRYTYIGTISNAVIWISILGLFLIYV